MKSKYIASVLLAFGLSAFTVNAWDVSGFVKCPNGNTASGIEVSIVGNGSTITDNTGFFFLPLPAAPATFTICVNPATLPAGATVVGTNCTTFSVSSNAMFATVNFTLEGPFCEVPPARCWLTGGGTVFKVKGQPHFTFGGVVNPGCSPTAAGGGNWNVIDHFTGLHFQGQEIMVLGCSGVPTGSPKVNVNIIDFAGTGILSGIGGNPEATIPVCFTARAIDNSEPGKGKDRLYLNVFECGNPSDSFLLISGNANPTVVAPVPISTGNLQIHTTGCNK